MIHIMYQQISCLPLVKTNVEIMILLMKHTYKLLKRIWSQKRKAEAMKEVEAITGISSKFNLQENIQEKK